MAMTLALLLLIPALGAAACLTWPGGRAATRAIALATSLVTLVLAVVVCVQRPEIDASWVSAIGLRLHLAVDGISIPLVLLTAVLTVLVIADPGSAGREGGRAGTYYAAILMVQVGALATFLARDAILFYLAFETVVVPMWVLIARFGDRHLTEQVRARAAYRFAFFTVGGGVLMLVGLLILVRASGTSDLGSLALAHGAGLSFGTQLTVAVLLVVGLGMKIPLWPAHTWLPVAHTVAPTAGSVLLAGVLLKMGTYGLVRLVVPTVPAGFATVAPWLAAVGAVGILWGSLACLVERDLKRLVAYSSIAHMGFVAIGIASGTSAGLAAALFGNIAHGLVSALLFLVAGGLKDRWGQVRLDGSTASLRETMPRLGFATVVGFAAALGLPGLVGFWGEVLAIMAAWSPAGDRPVTTMQLVAVAAAVGLALAAGYSLRVLRVLWAGGSAPSGTPTDPVAGGSAANRDARGLEATVMAVLVVAVLAGGVYPKPILEVAAPDVAAVLGVQEGAG